jgi:serine/threonine protein kinase
MNDLRTHLEAGPLRVLPVKAMSTHAVASNQVRDYRDRNLQRDLVGKIVEAPPEDLASDDGGWRPALLQEGRLQEQLRTHPNVMDVVAALDHYDDDGNPMPGVVEIFTPRMPLGSAFDIVRGGGQLNAAETVSIVRGAAFGLAAMHGLGYLHRDVKSPNIFVARTPTGLRGLIGDLGIAEPMDPDGTADGFRQATPWIAPEQVQPGGRASVRTDLFGLGATLVDLNTPFPASEYNRAAAGEKMMRGELAMAARHYRPAPLLPRRIRTLISTLTRGRADRRTPTSALAVADALDCAVPPWRDMPDADDELR